jgi:hypothetical protein
MSFLKSLSEDKSIKEETDTLGGGFLASGIYGLTIESAYLDISKGGAHSLNITAKTDEGQNVRQTFWMTNKKGENFYEYKGERRYLPGFNVANALSLLTTGSPLSELDEPVEKTLKIYDFDEKKEMPTQKDCLEQMHGMKVKAGIQKVIDDKSKLNEASGQYEPTGETRELNEIDKMFDYESGMTVAELRAEADEPAFILAWEEKWKGKDRMKAKGAGKGGAKEGAPAAAGRPKSSLFKKK